MTVLSAAAVAGGSRPMSLRFSFAVGIGLFLLLSA